MQKLIGLVVVMIAAVVVEPRLAAQEPSDAMMRLGVAIAEGLEAAPALRVDEARVRSEDAAARAELEVLSPWLEWQREGISAASGREPNAQDVVRVGTAVRYPWQVGHAKDTRRAHDDALSLELDVSRRQVAARVATGWIDLAVVRQRQEVARARLERLDVALALLEARFQLGEVAGTEVMQTDLEHVRATSHVEQLRAEDAAAVAALRQLAGDTFPLPRPGDVEALVEGTASSGEGDGGADGTLLDEVIASRSRAAAALSRSLAGIAWGSPEIELEWERVPELGGAPSFNAWGVRLRVPLPIGAAGASRRAAALARERLAAEHEGARRTELGGRLAAARAAEAAAEARLTALGPALERLPDGERSLAEQFRLGAASYLVLIDGLARLDEVRLEALAARQDLLTARLELAVLLDDPTIFPALPGGSTVKETS